MIGFKNILIWLGIGAVATTALTFVTPNFGSLGATKHGPFTPRLIDGDTLTDGKTRFRLAGVDACEMGQPARFADFPNPLDCGAYATEFVRRFIGANDVICYDRGQRSYERLVARCYIDTGKTGVSEDIGAFAIRSGWAVPTDHAGFDFGLAYYMLFGEAKLRRNGMWNAEVENPTTWRQGQK